MLRNEAEAYCSETCDADLEMRFGTPQQVAAAYVDAMSTQELLKALRQRRRVLTILIASVLAALLFWVAALCVSLYDYYDDGSYILIEKECSSQKTKALGSKSGSKQYKYYSAADELQWIVTLSADFTFNGTTSSCTYVREPKVEVYAGKWSAVSKSASKVGNVATGKVEMKKGGLFISKSIPVTVTLSCDKNGNLT